MTEQLGVRVSPLIAVKHLMADFSISHPEYDIWPFYTVYSAQDSEWDGKCAVFRGDTQVCDLRVLFSWSRQDAQYYREIQLVCSEDCVELAQEFGKLLIPVFAEEYEADGLYIQVEV